MKDKFSDRTIIRKIFGYIERDYKGKLYYWRYDGPDGAGGEPLNRLLGDLFGAILKLGLFTLFVASWVFLMIKAFGVCP